jgi:hypothetical protein
VYFIIFGALLIVGGVVAKDFYVADILSLSGFKQKMSRRSGRLLFIVGGARLIALGLKSLLVGK